MAGVGDVHLPTVLRGVALQVAITLPPVLVIRALTQDDVSDESYLPVLATLIALVAAPAVAAGYAARRRPQAPILHAAATTALGWMALAVVTVIRLSRRADRGLDALTILPLFALVEVGVGIAAAYLTTRSRRQAAP